MMGRFHPAARRLKEIVDSGELGILTKIEANLAVGPGFIKDNDIRMVYDLGGGVMMDMGCEFYSSIVSRTHDCIPYRLHIVHVAVPIRW
jgi:predicted dehydrogenase